MAPKHQNAAFDGSTSKRRKTISMGVKLDIIKRSENGETNTEISRALGFSRTTICTIVKDKERILQHEKSGATMKSTVISKQHNSDLMEMERRLLVWLKDQNQHVPVSIRLIQEKARELHKAVVKKKGEGSNSEVFAASRGWFTRFKARTDLHNFTLQSMPGRTYVPEEEKRGPCHKVSNNRLTLPSGSNASGDLNLKPLLVNEEARAPKARALSAMRLSQALAHIKHGLALIRYQDPNVERFMKVESAIQDMLTFYKETVGKKQMRSVQSRLEIYGFKRKSPTQSATPNPEEMTNPDSTELVAAVSVSPPASPALSGLSLLLPSDDSDSLHESYEGFQDPSLEPFPASTEEMANPDSTEPVAVPVSPPASPALSGLSLLFPSDDSDSLDESFEGF